MDYREYGSGGSAVVLLHGGPGAPGLERLVRHVADLEEFLAAHCPNERPALVGHSWGAMLALAYAAAHANRPASLALVGCGIFDLASRRRLDETRNERIGDDLRRRLARLESETPDRNEWLKRRHELTAHTESVDLTAPEEGGGVDGQANRETWDDMMRLQADGRTPPPSQRSTRRSLCCTERTTHIREP